MPRKSRIEEWNLEDCIVLLVLVKQKLGNRQIAAALRRDLRDIRWQLLRLQKCQDWEQLFAAHGVTFSGQDDVDRIFGEWASRQLSSIAS